MKQIGDVILTSRRALGMTQGDLAEQLDITQAALSRYENDLREPDEAMLERMGKALDVSTAFLTHSFRLQGAIAADAHMRRQRTTKASDWKLAEAKLNLYRMRAAFLLERVPMTPENHVVTFDPDDTSPTDSARLVRAQWKMPIGPVRNLVRWVESAGVIIVEQDFGTHRIDGLSQWASDYPVIMINGNLPTDRKRLTLAHELGHLVLHSTFIDADIEAQANEFAAEFLMPSHIIEPELRNLAPARLLAMKQVWGVSMQAIYERAYRLGKVTSADRQRFYRGLNSRGWKKTEPGSDRIPIETPELARSIGEMLVTKGGLTRDEAANLVGRRTASNETVFLPLAHRLRAV